MKSKSDPIVTMADMRKSGHCVSGIRRWFEGQGFDFKDFLVNGIAASKLLETGDALAKKIVEDKIGRG